MSLIIEKLKNFDLYRTILSFFLRITSMILSFLLLFSAGKFLDAYNYGLYVFIFTSGSSIGLIAALGQHILLIKHYRFNIKNKNDINHPILKINFLYLSFSLFSLIALSIIFYIISPFLSSPYNFFYIVFLFAIPFSIGELMINYFRINEKLVLALVPRENIWRFLSMLALFTVGMFGILDNGAVAAAIVTVILFLVVLFQIFVFFSREGTGFITSSRTLDKATKRQWRIESSFFAASDFFIAASVFLETVLIGSLIGLKEVAFYFIATRLAATLLLPVVAIDTFSIPKISAYLQQKDIKGAQSLISLLSFVSFSVAIVGYACLLIFGDFILGLFSDNFPQYINVLYVLGIISIQHAFFGPGTWILTIGGGEKFMLAYRSVLFAIYIPIMLVMGYVYGMIGIALAGFFYQFSTSLIGAYWTRKNWNINVMASSFLRTSSA